MTRLPDSLALNDGRSMPRLGLGVWRASNDEARLAVATALACGYRSIDTAAIYGNETGVGQGLSDAGLPRADVFVTTKVWNDAQGAETTPVAIRQSLERLGLDYVDLMLIHWPTPQHNRYAEAWAALIEARAQGLVRSIGVCNFEPDHLRRIITESGVTPVLNQIELHPYLQQPVLRTLHAELAIRTECWSPLAQSEALTDPVVVQIARRLQRTPAQVLIRWHLERDCIVIPKSVTPARIEANAAVMDFALSPEDHALLAALDCGRRLGPDPMTFN